MSLANLVVQPQVAYLFTDSGGWRTNGELVELVRKEIILPHVPAAITAIGMVAPVFKIAAKVAENVGDLQIEELMDLVRASYTKTGDDPEQHNSIWIVAEYSRAEGRAKGSLFFTSSTQGGKSQKPWTWYDQPLFAMPHFDAATVWPKRFSLKDPAVFDPRRDMMPAIEAQRARRSGPANHSPLAGDIMLTTVSAGGVEQSLLHSYGDQVGEVARAG